jgi:hypothetical protein
MEQGASLAESVDPSKPRLPKETCGFPRINLRSSTVRQIPFLRKFWSAPCCFHKSNREGWLKRTKTVLKNINISSMQLNNKRIRVFPQCFGQKGVCLRQWTNLQLAFLLWNKQSTVNVSFVDKVIYVPVSDPYRLRNHLIMTHQYLP